MAKTEYKPVKFPVKQENKVIVDKEDKVVARASHKQDAEFIVQACNLEYSTKTMTFNLWRIINFFNNNPQLTKEDPNLQKSVARVEKYLNEKVNYE